MIERITKLGMNPGYVTRNSMANISREVNWVPRSPLICPRCHTVLKRIHRTYIDDDDHEVQSEVLWKCACSSGDPIPVALEPNREDFPVGG